jgi:hypothetical protein
VASYERDFQRRHAVAVTEDLAKQVVSDLRLGPLASHAGVPFSEESHADGGDGTQVPCLPDDDFSVVYSGGISGLAR